VPSFVPADWSTRRGRWWPILVPWKVWLWGEVSEREREIGFEGFDVGAGI
jgi:hypothetical protein